MQMNLPFANSPLRAFEPVRWQLLKWVGNKQRVAHEIASYLPSRFGTYYEPFLGSGAVLATLSPDSAVGSDLFAPLVQIWQELQGNPDRLKRWYAQRWKKMEYSGKEGAYEEVKASFNESPNGADLVFLCRACYGGVVRFRKLDGHMSTPCGPHMPISPAAFAKRVEEWRIRLRHTTFMHSHFAEVMKKAVRGDVIYCDPPYVDTQSILYGAGIQLHSIARCHRSL